jgi:hypothetical protein
VQIKWTTNFVQRQKHLKKLFSLYLLAFLKSLKEKSKQLDRNEIEISQKSELRKYSSHAEKALM